MEGQESKQAGTGAINLIINAVLAYYFYQYAYANPDEGQCWAAESSRTPVATETAGYTNVTANFHSWFFWGFIINIVSLVVAVLQFIAAGLKSEGIGKLAACVAGPLGCVGLVWFIMGLVWRYGEAGNVCSGDYVVAGTDGTVQQTAPYAWKSGYFLNLYYLIVMWVLISVCACVCCVGIIAGVMAKANS